MASASSSARWVGRWSRRKRLASVPRRQSGTSSRTSRRASAAVSTTVGAIVVRPSRSSAARRNAEVEADVVADEHGVADEVDERAEHGADVRSRADQRIGEPGEHADPGRDRATGVDECLERRQALAAADLDGADLGDHVVVAVAAGGLEVEHAERRLGEGHTEIVEAALSQHRGNRHGAPWKHEHTFASRTTVRDGREPDRYDRFHGRHAGRRRRLRRRARSSIVTCAAPWSSPSRSPQEGQKLRPPLKYPAAFKPYLKLSRLPVDGARPAAPRRSRPTTRSGRASAPAPCPSSSIRSGSCGSSVPTAGPSASTQLIIEADDEASRADAAAALHREARRREAAEQVAERSRVEVVALEARVRSLAR